MVKSDTLHGLLDLLSLAGLCCFLFSAIYLAGIKPTKTLNRGWKLLRQHLTGLTSAWPVAVVRMKRLGINFAIAIVFFALGAGWQAHRYAEGIKSEKARELEKWKREYGEYQRVYTAWLKQHQELNPPGGGQ